MMEGRQFVIARFATDGQQVGVIEKRDATGNILVRLYRSSRGLWNRTASWYGPPGGGGRILRLANADDLRRYKVKPPPAAEAA